MAPRSNTARAWLCLCLLAAGVLFSMVVLRVHAAGEPPAASTPLPADDAKTETQKQIEAKNEEIKRLEQEADRHRVKLESIGRDATTLEAQVETLGRAINRLQANIHLSNAKIARTNLEIRDLGEGIREKEGSIDRQRGRLGYLVQILAKSDQETPLEIFMKHETVSAFFASVDNLLGIQRDIQSALGELRRSREELRERKGRAEAKGFELAALVDDLDDQKALQVEERRQRDALLRETRNQERRYQELLEEIERKREALQDEINALESGLAVEIDRSLIPAPSSGILGWPLPPPIFITQRFGRTSFARSGAYSGKGHNGIDLRAAAGTAVFAAERGTVRAVGDTDAICRRASYGRWVLIDHPNGLSTLSAHLSLIKVRPGDGVNRGELIGYSGRSGYATGPHLHLSVFARQAVNVGQLKSRVCGRVMTLPLSPFGGYLNPLSYLAEP